VRTRWTVQDIPTQRGKLAIVTGANSGIGWHTALELARKDAEVILGARSETKGRDAVARIQRELPQAKVRFEPLDLASLDSVRLFAQKVDREPKVDLLVNNAGVMSVPHREVTKDGSELQFGTNYVGPFALTLLLIPALRRAASARVTTVASGAANLGMKKINYDDLQWERSYDPWKAYCQSKLADLLFSLELARRCEAAGINVLSNSCHPGYARTNLQTSGPGRPQTLIERIMASFMSQDAAHGALPTLRAATAGDAAPGSYYAPDRLFGLKGDPVEISIPMAARDEQSAQRLWQISERLTGPGALEIRLA
jgi:NAD(P)-dependent dehydrogenase (short-subunit alcohol dehydrogenase family)